MLSLSYIFLYFRRDSAIFKVLVLYFKDQISLDTLHVTHPLDPIHMPTIYYKKFSKVDKVIEQSSFCLRTDRQTEGRQAERYIR